MAYLKLLLPCLVPIRYLSLAWLFFHLTLHKSNYLLRLVLLLPFLYYSVLSFIASEKFLLPHVTSLWAQAVGLNTIQITSIILLENHPRPRGNSRDAVLRPSSFLETWRIWCNPQLLPPQSRKDGAPKSAISAEEPKSVFLLLRLAKLVLYYYLYTQILPALFSETILEIFPIDVAEPNLFSRLDNVTAREAVVRSYVALSWIWESVVFLDGANAVLSLLAVLTGLDTPADWPPMFGGVDEIRGLRSFWANFWHRLALRPYKSFGRVVASGLLSLLASLLGGNKRFLLLERRIQGTIVAFVVFLVSGLSHAAVSWRLGMRDWLDVKWFLLNFLGCFIETSFLSGVRYLATRLGRTRELAALERSWLGRLIGCLWVFAFFFWSVPLWKFPRIQSALTEAERWKLVWSNMKICGGDIPCVP